MYLFVRRGQQVLLLYRDGTGYKDGEWGPPSGKVELGESYLDGGVRELEEEVGLRVDRADLRFVHAMERRDDPGPAWIGMFFEVEPDGEPENREPHKHSRMGWFRVDDLPEPTMAYIAHALRASERGERFSEWPTEAS